MENKKSFEKVYKCPTCGGIGKNQRMVEHIMSGTCTGRLTRRLREADRDGKYLGREAEAEVNTELLMKTEALKELKVSYQEMRQAIIQDIVVMKEINKSFIAEAYEQYYTEII
tara:strand:+ start:721 stop:1059 length:339 start_codon:yes stop_codon:yes gene_type:complete